MYRLNYQDGEAPQTYTFTIGEVVIGRSPDCQIVLKDFGISRTHARITVDDDGIRIADLKSKNGTQVNGVPVVEAPLKDGDKILLGKFLLTFSKALEGKVVLDEAKPLSEEAGTIIRSVGELSKLLAPSAPLWNKDQVIGIIHVDSPMLTNCFTLNDLDLLTALANYAAVAVERARMNQKIVAEQKKRERLGRFLSPQVTSRILATSDSQDAALAVPEVKDASVLFADIVGFTTMSEKMSPSQVALLLNDYLSRMTEVIFKYEGTLDKFIGDAIMAVFGAPLDMPDHAYRSIMAALEMQERLTEFNAERKEGPHLRIRIGINSGKVVAGEIGSINKKEYTVLGDTVNTASRLESSVAKPGMVVIGQNTHEMVVGRFECKSLGSFTLKGKEREVSVFEVTGAARPAAASGAAAGEA